jgi:hypothetical protein
MHNITSGTQDTALGYGALLQLTSGIQNVAIGRNSVDFDTTGGGNIGIGVNALLNNQTGNNNVALGTSAGAGVASNSFGADTLIGHQSGFSLTTGSNNIFLGYRSASTTATGTNNIALGYDIALPVVNGSNQLDIGNLLFGTGINGTASSLSTGNIGIGTTNPYSRLQVTGTDSASSTSAFAVVNNASTTEFVVFDGGNAQLAGTLTQSSDARLKTNVQSLDASSSLRSRRSIPLPTSGSIQKRARHNSWASSLNRSCRYSPTSFRPHRRPRSRRTAPWVSTTSVSLPPS